MNEQLKSWLVHKSTTLSRLACYALAFCVAVVMCGLLTFAFIKREYQSVSLHSLSYSETSETKSNSVSDNEADALLQRAASDALGGREGSIVIMDVQTGRVRSIVNPRLAAEHSFPPGSAIKPFTLLAALRTGAVAPTFKHLCSRAFQNSDYEIACSHPKSDAAFDLKQALAYSCNDCFAHIGERTNGSAWMRTIKDFGFGERTGVTLGGESAGRFRVRNITTRTVLGEDDAMLVTPLQMASAYAALINGGRLMSAKVSSAKNFQATERNRIAINDEWRETLIGGMRGAIKYGTAGEAGLKELPVKVFGKTGTSTASNNFRTQGWFVGFASRTRDREAFGDSLPQERVGVVVLVFLRRAQGADAAHVARKIFEEYARTLSVETMKDETTNDVTTKDETKHLVINDNRALVASEEIKIGIRDKKGQGEFKTASMNLDDYVAGVLAAESSVEIEGEALKAQSVTSRTFALANRGRHRKDGFDFCATTHCQRFVTADDDEAHSRTFRRMREVAGATSGEILIDSKGRLADSYFHASCGGATTNINRVWSVGESSKEYLTGSKDEVCQAAEKWTTRITADDARRVLEKKAEIDVGAKVTKIEVVMRDDSGRAEWLEVRGTSRTARVRGWDFKVAIGRALGWANLKSTNFEVKREGNYFVFRGTGFGHGLGLCQKGAHERAMNGATSHAILEHYYPRTNIVSLNSKTHFTDSSDAKDKLQKPDASVINANFQITGRQLTSEYFRVMYDDAKHATDAAQSLKTLETAYEDLRARFAAVGVSMDERRRFDVVVYRTTGDFTSRTGSAAWAGAVTIDGVIHVQPFDVLRRRGTLKHVLRHETLHAITNRLGAHPARWLAEGAAIIFANEERYYLSIKREGINLNELERELSETQNQSRIRSLYAAAMDAVRVRLREDEAGVWRELAGR